MAVNPWLRPKKTDENGVKVIVSKDFKNEKGEVQPWVLVPVSAERSNEIREECFIPNPDKRPGQPSKILDGDKYTDGLIAETVVKPDLRDKELWDYYEATSVVQCMNKMLDVGEKAKLTLEINKMYRISPEYIAEDVKEAKNA